jgi:Glyoxalase-like domain
MTAGAPCRVRWYGLAMPGMVGGDSLREGAPVIGTLRAVALELGATSLAAGGVNWRVYADPAGKPFCLCWD